MKINWLTAFGWTLVVAGFALRFAYFSVFNIPHFGTLVTFFGVGIVYFNHQEKKEKLDK